MEVPILFYPVSKCRSYNPKYMSSWCHSDCRSSHPWPDMNLSSDVCLDMWDRTDGPQKLIQELGQGGDCLLARACGNRRGNRLLKVAVRAHLTSLRIGHGAWWTTGARVRMRQINNPKDFCAGFPWLLAEVEDLRDTDNDQEFKEEELKLRKLIQKATRPKSRT